ncbi:MAG: hypothetical protein EPO32_09110 [Anaerolineae bacterium]|nr:MAG: hypothetical protein EPO32_09110 [Anaerolineae bacterium]
MDEFDFKNDPQPKTRARRKSGGGGGMGDLIWNLASLYFLGSAVCLVVFAAMIFMNPQASFNPFPPRARASQAVPTLIPFPTTGPATATTAAQPPTATTAPQGPTATSNPLDPTPTQFSFPAVTPSNTPSGQGVFFEPNEGDPVYGPHPDGCSAMYVGGSVSDTNGSPAIFWLVRMTGSFGTVDAYSGSNPAYGVSGYEIEIAAPQNTTGQVFMQIIDDLTGEAVSDLIIIDTKSSCSQNLILLNWTQTR